MNTSLKTNPHCSDNAVARRTGRLAAAFAAVTFATVTLSFAAVAMTRPAAPSAASAAPALRCSLQVLAAGQVGSPVLLQMKLSNTSAQTLRVLVWNTPFEGAWLGASVDLWRQGQPVPYQGPSVKRSAPAAGDYVEIAPGTSREASLDLGLVFDLSHAGTYELRPQFRLHDVQPGARTKPTPQTQVAMPLDCQKLQFTLSPKR